MAAGVGAGAGLRGDAVSWRVREMKVEALQHETVTLLVRCSTVEEALAVSGAVECDQDVMIGVDLP